ncbi:MAG: nucleotidyltransferase family protein [Desulfotomaculum sp.]|nr:nucleotidyltransferase family protein [Desulfotomaculum sp.]
MIDALVLAGSTNDGQLRKCSKVKFEALIPVGKKTMVEYVIAALLKSNNIRRVLLVGPPVLHNIFLSSRVEIIPFQKTLLENVRAGFRYLPTTGKVLVLTSDIPLITAEAIDDFMLSGTQSNAELFFPIVFKQIIAKKFPQAKRTYAIFKEGAFTGGNMVLVQAEVMERCLQRGARLVEWRKKPLKLCLALGSNFLGKYLTKRLTVAEAEHKVSELLGIKGRKIICNYPEIGMDVDKPEDLLLVKHVLGVRD